MSRCLHPAVERLAFLIPPALMAGLVTVILVWFSVDFAFSFQAAMDLRDILVRAERAKKELERMQKRLDVLIAVAGEELDSRKEAFEEKRDAFADWREEMARQREDRRENRREELRLGMEELLDGLEERFSRIRKELPASERLKEKREELMELRDRYVGSRRVREEKLEAFFRGANRRRLLGSNPSMRSKRFQDVLDDLKKAASEYRNRRDRD